ncbi:uncharacterized protein EAE98_008933 [Botrytis deweyae]|uniref:Glucose-methanol-choline oxidoreductase N-terminal domain-containing protein n=1 Tax=Botrytis deweyae TaxID=2478750 RepID=A0ABQ7IDI0_9HELO|nr:uncharacterized protein EAE98_008933 [Botrytis deweyae]KAF7920904.1 hypothetical protein EAE98_008933 [Botrytis deweyae]
MYTYRGSGHLCYIFNYAVLQNPVWLLLLASCNLVASSASSYSRDESVFAESYDYIIVGGGTSGLVVANRLSEDPTNDSSLALIPRLDLQYFPNNVKNWDYISAPVEILSNATFNVYIADVVGGSSLHMLGTFTPPSEELKTHFDIRNNASGYGNKPIQIGYPSFIFRDYRNQTLAAEDFGIEISDAPESGDAIGFYWVPQTLDPKTGFRSHSRVAYYDPITSRPNLHLIPGHLVEKILFDDNLTATGVELTSVQTNQTQIVSAKKEVILAAGAINTPKLLQFSGICPTTVLEAVGVQVLLDEPAVGANFQDHPVTYLGWNGQYTQGTFPDAAFIPLSFSQLISPNQEIIDQARAQNVSNYIPSIYLNSSALLKGYLTQRDIILNHFSRTNGAVIEIPIGTTGPEILAALISVGAIAPSFAHSSGMCALGKREWGGCVGKNFSVYGLRKVSVADASVMPLVPATHLQLTVFGVAEKAGDIIKGRT